MVNAGTPDVEVLDDEWTAVTKDRSMSAHFEHTIAILDEGPYRSQIDPTNEIQLAKVRVSVKPICVKCKVIAARASRIICFVTAMPGAGYE